jgi:AbrB family looped-hinge helix DNA binding protein
MPIVRVKKKYQVTLPADVRERAGLAVGDLLEAKIEKGKITLTPKALIDRRIEESLEDFKKGRFYGPYSSVDAMIRSLRSKRLGARRKPKRS